MASLAAQMIKNLPVMQDESEVAQSCPTLCDPMDCSLPVSSVHGIFQARILEWVTTSFSRGSSPPRDWNWVSRIAGRCFTVWATREVRAGSPWGGNAGDLNSIPGSRRSPGEGNGNPLQYSCLENPRDGGAWRATVAESDTTEWLNNNK